MGEDGLRNLMAGWRGEMRTKNLAGRVLADYRLIETLRAQKCPWHRIATAMGGANPDSLRRVFGWLKTRVEAGAITPPEAVAAPIRQTGLTQPKKPTGASEPAPVGKERPGFTTISLPD